LLPHILAMAICSLGLVCAVVLLLLPAVDASIVLLVAVAAAAVFGGLIAFYLARAAKAAEEESVGFINVDMNGSPERVLETAVRAYQGSMTLQETWADQAVLVSYEGNAVVLLVLKVTQRDERTTRLRGDIYGESSTGMIVLGVLLMLLILPLPFGIQCLKTGKRKANVHVREAMAKFDQIKSQVGTR
jgi:hypothetical protein